MATTASMEARRIASSGNILLRRLGRADQALLEPHAEKIAVTPGDVLLDPASRLDAVYFPDTALLSLEEAVGDGRRLEIGLVGREGLLGWPALLGGGRSSHLAVARMRAGTLLRIGAEPLRAACARSASLWGALLHFVDTIIVQMGQAIAANLQATLDRRLARFLLMRHDRVGGDLLVLQHDEIAASLHVRRASVTDRLHLLEGDRLIRCNRGRVLIRDRAGLELFAGDAYGVAEARYRALIAPFGKSPLPVAVAA